MMFDIFSLVDQVLERFRPDLLLTYGGHPACLELMRRARMKSIAVVFHLHNFGYNDRRAFADTANPPPAKTGNRTRRRQARPRDRRGEAKPRSPDRRLPTRTAPVRRPPAPDPDPKPAEKRSDTDFRRDADFRPRHRFPPR